MRRAAAVVTLLFGIWILIFTFAFNLFGRTSDADKVTDAFRTTLSDRGLVALEQQYGVIRGFGLQFVGELRPALAQRLGMTVPEFDRYVSANFPAVGAAVRNVPGAIALVDPVIPRLERVGHSGDFDKVDDIPGLGLPTTVLPWLLLGIGGFAIVMGIVALRAGARWPLAAAGTVGAAVVIGALALQFPAKFNAAHRIVPVGRVALSRRAADTATQTVAGLNAVVPEVRTRLVPALAAKLGRSPAQVQALIAQRYPAVATGLAEWSSIAPSAAVLAARQRANVKPFAEGDGAPFRTLPWLVIGPALLVAMLCGIALVRRPS